MSSKGSLGPTLRKTGFAAVGGAEKRKVGSVNADINYAPETKAFEPSDMPANVLPPQVKATVREVKASTDIDILGTRAPRWNSSVFADQHKPYEAQVTFPALKFSIRHGLRDDNPVPLRDKLVYEGVDFRNDYTRWNVSTETISHDGKRAVTDM